MLVAPIFATATPTMPLLVLLLASVRLAAAAAERNVPPVLAARRPQPVRQWRRDDGRVNYYRRLLTSGIHLPRGQWQQSAATAVSGEQHAQLARRQQRHFLASTVGPAMGHWRSIHDKLQMQSTWPGTGRYADQTSLLATTVR